MEGPQGGLVARYDCDEGSGELLLDRSGCGHHGRLHGARYVRCGKGWALRLDGRDDYVDCGDPPGLRLSRQITVEAWVYPEAVPAVGEAGIVGKDYGSYVLTYYTDGQCWWYISGGGNNCRAPLPPGAWHHVVGTFDGERLCLYLDGRLVASKVSDSPTIGAGASFFIGTSGGDPQFTRGAHFQGLIDEVRVYSRALSAAEVWQHYRTTHLIGELQVSPLLSVFDESITVRIDPRALGRRAEGGAVVVELRRPDSHHPLTQQRCWLGAAAQSAQVTLKVPGLKAGRYQLVARALSARGVQIGESAMASLDWPPKPRWPEMEAQTKVLNCLVTELLRLRGGQATGTHGFANPRDGWVFVRVTASGAGGGCAKLVPAGGAPQPLVEWQAGETAEAMRWLPKGRYELAVAAHGQGRIEELVVRAVPELVFCQFGAHPHVREYGLYDWAFLSRYVLPHVNTVVSGGAAEDRPFAEQWRRAGKRWLVACPVPGLAEDQSPTVEEVAQYWAERPGMADPAYDGLIADEFLLRGPAKLRAWAEAVRRLQSHPALRSKLFYAWVVPLWADPDGRHFLEAVLKSGGRLAFERYLPEQPTEEAAWACLRAALTEPLRQWQQAMPGIERQLILCLGYLSQPPESLNINPGVDFKVFMDLQFYHLANDPTFFGLYGVMEYLSSYCDEENVRWAAKLYRHYCLEGRADRLSHDPYLLPHLQNPDFAEGLAGWQVQPAEPGSVTVKSMPGLSWLQGRYPLTSEGDQFLCLRRSARGPNRVSQTVRALQPGRLYSLKLYAADWHHLEQKQQLAVRVRVEGVEMLPGKSFVHVFPNCYSHHYGPFDAQQRAWFNYHWQVFRARSRQAKLVISDWADEQQPGGPAGQEIAVNFVELQPYLPP
jgi:hypothetical protein